MDFFYHNYQLSWSSTNRAIFLPLVHISKFLRLRCARWEIVALSGCFLWDEKGKSPRKRVLELILTIELPWLRVMPTSVAAEGESTACTSFHVCLWKLLPRTGDLKAKTLKCYAPSCISPKENKKDAVKWQAVKLPAHGRKGSEDFEELERDGNGWKCGIHVPLWLYRHYKEAKLSFLQSSPPWPG